MAGISVETRFGDLTIWDADGALVRVDWDGVAEGAPTDLLRAAQAQLAAYDAGQLQEFDLPIRVDGSAALKAVCAAMRAIPFGETVTYGEIAKATGLSAQAVGQLCGANPLPVLIPCHRVMGVTGLTGYSGKGGVETKVALLRHEGAAGLLI